MLSAGMTIFALSCSMLALAVPYLFVRYQKPIVLFLKRWV